MTNELQTKLDAILEDKNTNLLPENLKKNVTCLGITGTLENSGIDTSDATAVANDILTNKTAYTNGEKITGTLRTAQRISTDSRFGSDTIEIDGCGSGGIGNNTNYITVSLRFPAGTKYCIDENTRIDIEISGNNFRGLVGVDSVTPDMIKSGQRIFNTVGTYEPDYTELGTITPTEYDTAVATSEDILGTIDIETPMPDESGGEEF